MCDDRPVVHLHAPGVYLVDVSGDPPTDGVLVDRTHADARWLALADVVVTSPPTADPTRLVRSAALAYHARVSRTPARTDGTA
ncbi:MAG: hypothetical protein GEV28_05325 [Actinophytocola sp.]|uniref:hypothetical protein n=1 Tax=Actinophytocola sp. TaxID=1872138 RepID=UPI0013288CED|nr:hypothetical protein [Actinophytocola sp.]MPZ79837.1 hypothetical protein [Actinophytocola sp.]